MKKYFITGLLIWIPLVITIWVLLLVVDTLDQTLLLLPPDWRPERWLGIRVRGMGVVLTVLIVFLTGVLAANFIGQRLVQVWNDLLHRIPFFSSVYSAVKQVSDTLFSSKGEAFRKAVLVQWPREGMWTIAFLTGVPGGDAASHLKGDYVSVYVPTTPNPTGGYFVMLARSDVIELDMSVDDALKYVVSMGVAVPNGHAEHEAVRNGRAAPER
ncbi:MAG: DUF502 domain-containing protein [Burkholderiales bacterium]|nr:DUF502 domain-containing protein [Burkholderiales bacterium]